MLKRRATGAPRSVGAVGRHLWSGRAAHGRERKPLSTMTGAAASPLALLGAGTRLGPVRRADQAGVEARSAAVALRRVDLHLGRENAPCEVGALQVGIPEFRADQVGGRKVGSTKVGGGQVGAAQVHAAEVGSAQVRAD